MRLCPLSWSAQISETVRVSQNPLPSLSLFWSRTCTSLRMWFKWFLNRCLEGDTQATESLANLSWPLLYSCLQNKFEKRIHSNLPWKWINAFCKCSSVGPSTWEALGEAVIGEWRINVEHGLVQTHSILCSSYWRCFRYSGLVQSLSYFLSVSQSFIGEEEKLLKIQLESKRNLGNSPKQSPSVTQSWYFKTVVPRSLSWRGQAVEWHLLVVLCFWC